MLVSVPGGYLQRGYSGSLSKRRWPFERSGRRAAPSGYGREAATEERSSRARLHNGGAAARSPTHEIKRERAASREAKAEPLDLAEKLYMLEADKMLLRTGKLTTTITAPSQAPSGEKRFHCRH
jgi:hypothetical protein